MRVLLLLLGAARYPFWPALGLAAFPKAQSAFKASMTSGETPLVAPDDCLDLFDDDAPWAEQQRRISEWLAGKRAASDRPDTLLLYYVGHGGVAKGGSQVHLTINATTKLDPYFSSIPRESLATLLRASASDLRKFLIIDCCFAAAVVKLMQSPIADKMTVELGEIGKAVRKPNSGGLAALCASSSIASASADGHDGLTQFTDALLTVLRKGNPRSPDSLSFEAVRALIEDELEARYGVDAVAPSSYFPDDYAEPIHRLPIFPNHARAMAAPSAPSPRIDAPKSKRKQGPPPAMAEADLKQCTADELHYFPLDYRSEDCPLKDGGLLVPVRL